jgi:hypothetical protein
VGVLLLGRERKVAACLGLQTVSQLPEQYGRDGAGAVLGLLRNQIFLPGLDDESTQYASRLLGRTTTLSRSSKDAPGREREGGRESETGRPLRDPSELRRMVKFVEAVAVIDTLPPIRFTFPPSGETGRKFEPERHHLPETKTLDQVLREKSAVFLPREESARAAREGDRNVGAVEVSGKSAGGASERPPEGLSANGPDPLSTRVGGKTRVRKRIYTLRPAADDGASRERGY